MDKAIGIIGLTNLRKMALRRIHIKLLCLKENSGLFNMMNEQCKSVFRLLPSLHTAD